MFSSARQDQIMHMPATVKARKGRGAASNDTARFERVQRVAFDDGWGHVEDDQPPRVETRFDIDATRTIIARNDSPDIGFDRSINPYQGCEHGCIYCYARPSHAYLDLSPGLDFETRLFAKPNAVELLRTELAHPGYRCEVMALGTNTDPYQPIEREWKITRQILQLLAECNNPVAIVTKSSLIERDIDILAPMAARNMARVFISITTLDKTLARKME